MTDPSDVHLELHLGQDALSVEGPQKFVEERLQEFLAIVGRSPGRAVEASGEANRLAAPAGLRQLYERSGSTKQWENVVLFVHYFQRFEDKEAVTYDEIRQAYRSLGIKAPNIQAAVNSLKFNMGLLQKIRRGAVALTEKGKRFLNERLDGEPYPEAS